MFAGFAEDTAVEASVDTVDDSPLNVPLLSAVKNSDSQKAVGGGDVSVEDGALIAAGPVGKDKIEASPMNDKGKISVYTVDTGDSLSQIAQMYGVTTNTIIWANDLKNANDIQPGDSLVILPFVGVRHTVVKGETLASIIKKYNADSDEVLQYNNLSSSDVLAVGDEIMIPGGEIVAPVVQKAIRTATPTKTSSNLSLGSSWLTNPAPGSIKTQGIHGYNGVDLASRGGAHIPILAAASGEVIVSKSSGWNGGYGQYVVIKHSNGTQTLYGHLSKNLVGVGDYVNQGEQIGSMGNTGQVTGVTGVHLHFEVRGGVNPF